MNQSRLDSSFILHPSSFRGGGIAVGRCNLILAGLLLALATGPDAAAQTREPAPLPPALQQPDPLTTAPPGRVSGGRPIIATSGPDAGPIKPVVPIPDDGLSQPRPTKPLRQTPPDNPVVIGSTSRSPGGSEPAAVARGVQPVATAAEPAAAPVPVVAAVA